MTTHLAIESIKGLPPDWRVIPFRRVAQERGSRNSDLCESALSLSSKGSLYERTDETDRQIASEQSSRNAWLVYPGDLVVNPMWLFGGAIGVSDRRGAVSPDYRVYRLSELLHPRFVHHLLRSAAYRDQYRLYMRAETTFDRRITKDDFRELPVLIPPLAYQGAIARYLDVETMRIDELLGALRRLDAATADRAQAETAQACDGASVRVKNLVTKIGSGKTPSGGSEAYVSQGVALLRSMNVRNGFFDLSDVAYIDADTDLAMASTRLRAGDVLLTITGGSIGRSAVVPQDIGPANVNQHVCILRPKSGVPSPLLSAALLTPAVQGQISAVQVGGNRDGLTFEQVGELLLPWPASDLARAEARVEVALASSARIHAAVASQIDLLLERRQAVITASVTGQIEIPGVAA